MFDAVKVFAATKQKEREELGETITRWLDQQRGCIEIVDKTVTQSSDREYHCLAVTIFYRRQAPRFMPNDDLGSPPSEVS